MIQCLQVIYHDGDEFQSIWNFGSTACNSPNVHLDLCSQKTLIDVTIMNLILNKNTGKRKGKLKGKREGKAQELGLRLL